MDRLHLLQFQGLPVLEQLQLEEALLRADDRFWCLINRGTSPAIVMGISGKVEEIDLECARRHDLPIIRRFSGGGTVVVDQDTLMVTFLGPKEVLEVPCFPEPIMRWTGGFYAQGLGIPDFAVRENDYVIGDLKCGGNAQYLRKERWLHHTSFLWDYTGSRMACLKMPRRTPEYRKGRTHGAFLTSLKRYLPSLDQALVGLRLALESHFNLVDVDPALAHAITTRPHRKATLRIS